MEREGPIMATNAPPTEKTTAAPSAVQDRADETPIRSPKAFYEKLVKRPDVREILTRLATMDRGETRDR